MRQLHWGTNRLSLTPYVPCPDWVVWPQYSSEYSISLGLRPRPAPKQTNDLQGKTTPSKASQNTKQRWLVISLTHFAQDKFNTGLIWICLHRTKEKQIKRDKYWVSSRPTLSISVVGLMWGKITAAFHQDPLGQGPTLFTLGRALVELKPASVHFEHISWFQISYLHRFIWVLGMNDVGSGPFGR